MKLFGRTLSGPPIALTIIFLITLQTFMWGVPLFSAGLIKRFIPITAIRRQMTRLIIWMAESWVSINGLILHSFLATEWRYTLPAGLRRDGSYLIISNHASSVDIFALSISFNKHIPLTRYFVKRQVSRLPVIGFGCWALDMPFMQRYSKATLVKRPELRGKDMETTRRSCERLVGRPTTLVNFAEGTRIRPKKHAAQQSPYTHLLKPRAGGSALVLNVLGPQLDAILHCTLVYPTDKVDLWDFLCGSIHHIVLQIDVEQPSKQLLDLDYLNNRADRSMFQSWLNECWLKKDRLIEQLSNPV